MVSGRQKAYVPAEPAGDYLANDTSASAFSAGFKVREDAQLDKQFINIEGRRFSRKTINRLVAKARDSKNEAIFLHWYVGETAQLVEMQGKRYVGLMKLQGRGGFRRFIVYDFLDKKMEHRVKEARTKLETCPHEQEGSDDIYLDDIAALEVDEY